MSYQHLLGQVQYNIPDTHYLPQSSWYLPYLLHISAHLYLIRHFCAFQYSYLLCTFNSTHSAFTRFVRSIFSELTFVYLLYSPFLRQSTFVSNLISYLILFRSANLVSLLSSLRTWKAWSEAAAASICLPVSCMMLDTKNIQKYV